MYQDVSEMLNNGVIDLSGRFMIPVFLTPVYGIIKQECPGLIKDGSTNDSIMENWAMVKDRSIVPQVAIQGQGQCINLSMKEDQQIITSFKGYITTLNSISEIRKFAEKDDIVSLRRAVQNWFNCMVPFKRVQQYGKPYSDAAMAKISITLNPWKIPVSAELLNRMTQPKDFDDNLKV